MASFNLKVITPSGVKFNEEIISLETTTAKGRIGIYANHVNLIAELKPNIFIVKLKNNNKEEYIVISGHLFFENNEAKIITNYFEERKDINVNDIKEQITILKNNINNSTIDSEQRIINSKIEKFENILNVLNK